MNFALRFIRNLGLGLCIVAFVHVAAAQTASVTLGAYTTPGSGQPSIGSISVSGSGFPAGSIAPANVTVQLQPAAGATGPTVTTAATQVTVLSSGFAKIYFVIPAALTFTSNTNYLVTISGSTSGGSFNSKTSSKLTILAPASITSLNPTSGQAGQTLQVTITGNGTHFGAGTQASFGPGISVGGAAAGGLGPVTATSTTSATAQIAIQSAASSGPRNITVTTGTESATAANAFTVQPGAQISASTGGPYQGDIGIPIAFAGSATGGNGTLTFSWSFGDNTSGSGANPTHAYTAAGTYQATLTVTDSSQNTVSGNVNVKVAPLPTPNPGGPYQGSPGQPISFTSTSSGGTGAVTFTWDFGDGATASGASVSHTYASSGTEKANLTVTDAVGGAVTVPFNVTVQKTDHTPPVVAITSPAPLTLFNSSSSGLATVSGTVQDPDDVSSAITVTVNGIAGTVNSDGSFSVANVPLREGPQTLTATATDAAGNPGTASISVTLDTTPPVVKIGMPTDGAQLAASSVDVTGNVNDTVSGLINAAQVGVKVNGVDAAVTNGTFSVADLPLTPGDNIVTAVATDKAGNQSSVQVHVKVAPAVGQQHLLMQGGNNESASIGQSIADPLLVQLVDASGAAVVNRPITFTVSRGDGVLNPSGQNAQTITLQSDNNGQASVVYQLGSRAGVGLNQVTVSADGVTGQVVFSETSTVGAAAVVNVVSGDQQNAAIGMQVTNPLVVIALDVAGNPVPGVPITFTVMHGGGSVSAQAGTLIASIATVNTDANGNAQAFLTVGPQEGNANNTVTATFAGSSTSPATFTASGMQPGDASQTQVSGVVLDNADAPIPGVTVKIVGTELSAVTSDQGQFSIPNAPVGSVSLLVDGGTANVQGKTYPVLNFELTTVAGHNNTLGMPIYLPVIDIDSSQVVGGDQDVILQMKGVPGYQFKIFAHSATFPDGSHTGRMSLSQVHVDKVPMTPPNGSAPSLAGTLQPPGVVFNPPVQVQFPNTAGLSPGTVVTLYTYDHDLEQFISQGPAHVSADGSVVVSDTGFGITKSGWHFAPPPPPPHSCVVSCPSNDPCNVYSVDQNSCSCVSTPAPDGTSCGSTDTSSCKNPGTCTEGVCLGGDKPDGTTCDDGLFCTQNDKCNGAGSCEGTKVDDKQLGQFQVSSGFLNNLVQGLQAFESLVGSTPDGSTPDFNVSFQKSETESCCEQKQQMVDNGQYQGVLNVGWKGEDHVLVFPPWSGDYSISIPGFGKIGAKYGAHIQFGFAVQASVSYTQDKCQGDDAGCLGGSLGAQISATGGLEGVAYNPFVTSCDGSDCVLLALNADLNTGVSITTSVNCKQIEASGDWQGLTAQLSVSWLEGTIFSGSAQLSLPLAQPHHIFDSVYPFDAP